MPKGIYERPTLVGKKFSELEVMSLCLSVKKRRLWKCKCSCGEIINVKTSDLNSGNKVSCGHSKGIHCWRGFGEISGSYWGQIRRGAKVRNIEFAVTIEHAWEVFLEQEKKCIYTGKELNFYKRRESRHEQTASLDRIDSLKGYIPGNIQWVHRKVNSIKLDLTESEFIEICLAIKSNYENKEKIK